jgi:hypothetical protein
MWCGGVLINDFFQLLWKKTGTHEGGEEQIWNEMGEYGSRRQAAAASRRWVPMRRAAEPGKPMCVMMLDVAAAAC